MALSWLREFFFLERARQRARALAPGPRARAAAYLRAAERRLRAGPPIALGEPAVVSLSVARDAVALLVRAYAAAQGAEWDDERLRDLAPAEELARVVAVDGRPPAQLEASLAALGAGDPLYFDRLDAAGRDACAAGLEAATNWLRARIDVRSETNLRATSVGRLAALGVVLVYLVVRAVATPNLAYHKTVTQSSSWPGSAPGGVLVDGDTTGAVGPGKPDPDYVHTGYDAKPWVMIDLGKVHTLTLVRVYNRNDTSFDDGLPYEIELSQDGNLFTKVASRDTHFGSSRFDAPWSEKLPPGTRGRFVRLRCQKYLALSEVEVFGR